MKLKQGFVKMMKKFDSVESTNYYIGTIKTSNDLLTTLGIESYHTFKLKFLFMTFKKKFVNMFQTINLIPPFISYIAELEFFRDIEDDSLWHIDSNDVVYSKVLATIKDTMYSEYEDYKKSVPTGDKVLTFDEVFDEKAILERFNNSFKPTLSKAQSKALKPFLDCKFEIMFAHHLDTFTSTFYLRKVSNEGHIIFRMVTLMQTPTSKNAIISPIQTIVLGLPTLKKLKDIIILEDLK